MSANKMLEMEIRAAYIFLREKNHTIPSDTLQFMLDASLEKLNSVEYNEVLDTVSKPFCNNCKSGLKNYPEINRRTCSCGALGYNVTE